MGIALPVVAMLRLDHRRDLAIAFLEQVEVAKRKADPPLVREEFSHGLMKLVWQWTDDGGLQSFIH